MQRTFISWISIGLVCLTLAACGSSVPLSSVPVEDRATSTVPSKPVALDPAATAKPTVVSTVNADDLARQELAGPVGVERLVYFDFNSFVIKSEYQAVVEAHAKFLSSRAARKVAIEGHTDERGGREYNLALGQKRSEAVRSALNLLGVPESQIEAVSFGKEKPAVEGADEESFAKNRRAEIFYR